MVVWSRRGKKTVGGERGARQLPYRSRVNRSPIRSPPSPAATINSPQLTPMAVHNEIIINRKGREHLVDSQKCRLILKRGLALSVGKKTRGPLWLNYTNTLKKEKKKRREKIYN